VIPAAGVVLWKLEIPGSSFCAGSVPAPGAKQDMGGMKERQSGDGALASVCPSEQTGYDSSRVVGNAHQGARRAAAPEERGTCGAVPSLTPKLLFMARESSDRNKSSCRLCWGGRFGFMGIICKLSLVFLVNSCKNIWHKNKHISSYII